MNVLMYFEHIYLKNLKIQNIQQNLLINFCYKEQMHEES